MSEFADGLKQGLSFVIKNQAPQGKKLTIFNYPVLNGATVDLMQIPGVSEDDIKASVLKGDLGRRLRIGHIVVTSSTLTFENLDPTYTALLASFGLSTSSAVDTIANATALTAFSTSGLSEGDEVYVQSYRTNFKLRFAALTLRPHSVIASDNSGKVWIRSLGPNEWTYQYDWFYNKDTGNDENDGSENFPIKTLDEWCRRVRVMSAGTNATQNQYTINLQTDVAATDTWFPSALIQADGVQIGRDSPDPFYQPTIRGFRRVISVPGGSGVFTAASALTSITNRTKATLTDGYGVFTTLVGQMVMCADTATAASGSGAAASLTAASGIVTLTGGTGFTTSSLNRMIIITGASTPANNGAFPITKFISATSVQYSNPNATASDTNNGAISWTEKASKIAWIINAPAFTTGSGITVTAVSAGIATLANAPASTFTSAAVGKRIRLSGGLAANNVEATIVEFVSDTSVKIANVNAVVDATVQTFQGVVEVGSSWYDNATLTVSAAPPSSGSPYVVVRLADVPQRSWGLGKPAGLGLAFVDCQLSTNQGISSGQEVRPTTCRFTNGGFLAGGAGTSLQSLLFATVCCWVNPSPGFGTLIFKENGYNRFSECVWVGYNILYREGLTQFNALNSVLQGGHIGPSGEEAGSRFGSASGFNVNGNRGVGIFNNVENSHLNPGVSTGSAGSAMTLCRDARCLSSAVTGGKLWGVGALIGIHIKEGSRLFLSLSNQPNLTDTAGHAGFPVNEVKLGAQNPIPVTNATTGVPTAVTTTSGTNPTFTATNGIITVVASGTTFTAESVGRTLTIAGANTAANNGTYTIQSFISGTSVTIRNTAGVTDAVGAGTVTENSVITRWSQLNATPYSGTAQNYVDGSAIIRVVGS